MRRATASTWLLGLMVGFILIFVAYILMSINYSRTIRIKNDMISMIERYEGLNSTSLALVNNYLGSINHRVTGDCGSGSGFYGAPDLNSATLEPAQGGKKYFYCIKKFKGAGTSNYYQVTVFYRFNLPVVGAAGIFTVRGVTGNFQPFDDSAYAQATDGSYTSGIHSPSPGGGGGGTTPPTTPTYAVTFNLNGGIGMVSTQYIKSGNKASMPSNTPVRDGYTFNGWKLNGSSYDFNSAVTGNITLTADWQMAKKYTIVFDFDGGVWGTTGWSKITDYENEGYNKMFDGFWDSTTKSGYVLDYFIDQDGNKYYKSNASFKVSKDMTLKAVWK